MGSGFSGTIGLENSKRPLTPDLLWARLNAKYCHPLHSLTNTGVLAAFYMFDCVEYVHCREEPCVLGFTSDDQEISRDPMAKP